MNYVSTRNSSKTFKFEDVFIKGLADDGGLFVPKSIKQFKKEELNNLKNLSYNDLAAEIIYPFIGDFMSKDDLISMISKSSVFGMPTGRDFRATARAFMCALLVSWLGFMVWVSDGLGLIIHC